VEHCVQPQECAGNSDIRWLVIF